MLIYFAGADNKAHAKMLAHVGAKNILVSYHTLLTQGTDLDYIVAPFHAVGIEPSLFLDSGGFVARLKNKPIDVRKYALYAHQHRSKLTVAANLDTNSIDESQRNFGLLAGTLRPKPVLQVYHPTEFSDPSLRGMLKDFCDEHDYIAIGGVAGARLKADEVERYLDYVFSVTQDRTKVHGFGITKMSLLKKYPFYSVDSTTWINGGMYGEVFEFDGMTVEKHKSVGSISKNKEPALTHVGQLAHYKRRMIMNAEAFLGFEKFITELWTARGITWN